MLYFLKRSVFLLGVLPLFLFAQNKELKLEYAREAYQAKEYAVAIVYYEDLLVKDKRNTDLLMEAAAAYRAANDFRKALRYYKSAVRSDRRKGKYPEATYLLGMMYKSQGKYDKAIKELDKFIEDNKGQNTYYLRRAIEEKKACDWALNEGKQKSDVQLRHLEESVNSIYSDFAPWLQGDSVLYFSSIRPLFPLNEYSLFDNVFQTSVFVSRKGEDGFAMAEKADFPAMPDGIQVGNACFSLDGDRVYFSGMIKDDGQEQLWLYSAERKGQEWSVPLALEVVNKKGYRSTQPCLVMNPLGEYVLYFSSDRPGTYGGMDIWYAYSKDGLHFEMPKNAGEGVNTEADELTPFYLAEQAQLFYSSNGKMGLGGYDIFMAFEEDGVFLEAQNVGQPLNTNLDDLYFRVNALDSSGYFVSNRKGALYYQRPYCCYDIFSFRKLPDFIKEEKQEELLVVLDSVERKDSLKKQPEVSVVISDATDSIWYQKNQDEVALMDTASSAYKIKRLLPLTLYFHNDIPKKAMSDTLANKEYAQTLREYMDLKELYIQAYIEGLEGAQKQAAIEEMDDFFEQEVKGGFDKLEAFCVELAKELKAGRRVKIIVRGYTSPLASGEYNTLLAKRRIHSMVMFMRLCHQGAIADYLDAPQKNGGFLEIIEEPLGEQQNSTVSDNPNDIRNSVYGKSAAMERNIKILYYDAD